MINIIILDNAEANISSSHRMGALPKRRDHLCWGINVPAPRLSKGSLFTRNVHVQVLQHVTYECYNDTNAWRSIHEGVACFSCMTKERGNQGYWKAWRNNHRQMSYDPKAGSAVAYGRFR